MGGFLVADTFEQLRAEFLSETEDTLLHLQQDLNELSQAINKPELPSGPLDRVFRTLHSLKGVAGMFGLAGMSAVAHSLENVLEALRRRRVALDHELAGLLHRGNDVLHEMLAAGAAGGADTAEAGKRVIAAVERALVERVPRPAPGDGTVATILARLDDEEQARARQAARDGARVVAVTASLPLEGFETPFRRLLEAARAWGTVHGSVSDDPDAAAGTFPVHLVASGTEDVFPLLKSVGPLGAEVLLPDKLVDLQAPPVAVSGDAGPASEAAPTDEAPPAHTADAKWVASLRVPVERVDRLMTQLGDLIQAKMALDETARRLLEAPQRTSPPMLRQSLRSLDRHIRALQTGILGVRLVSLRPLFQKLERTFREACRVTGKHARLHTAGEHLELDKGVVEPLAEAMIHLVRNAIDHGIEPADRREEAGKDRLGTVRVVARAEGSHTILEVGDDGAGIPLELVRERAIECGILGPGAEPSRGDLLDLVFRPGFTLRDAATEISGRGVGLDAARDTLARIGGTVEIADSAPTGTVFRLRVPISLAVTQALEVEAGGQEYFLPLSHVRRVLRVGDDLLRPPVDEDDADAEPEEPAADASLRELLAPGTGPDPARSAVLLQLAERRLRLRVERVGRRREIVVRSLGPLLPNVPFVAGCTELGDGRTVLILDPISLFEAVGPVGVTA